MREGTLELLHKGKLGRICGTENKYLVKHFREKVL